MTSDHIKLEIGRHQNVDRTSEVGIDTIELDGNRLKVYGWQDITRGWEVVVDLTDEQLAALRGTAGKLPWQPIKLGRRDRL